MQIYRAEEINALRIAVGASVLLESLRQAVVPPYLMLMPFIDVPDGIVVDRQEALDEDGVHGCVFQLTAVAPSVGEIVLGFRDMRTDEVTHRKAIQVETE